MWIWICLSSVVDAKKPCRRDLGEIKTGGQQGGCLHIERAQVGGMRDTPRFTGIFDLSHSILKWNSNSRRGGQGGQLFGSPMRGGLPPLGLWMGGYPPPTSPDSWGATRDMTNPTCAIRIPGSVMSAGHGHKRTHQAQT
jgi:hypothetical protein